MSGIPEISEAHIVAQIRSLRVDPFNIFDETWSVTKGYDFARPFFAFNKFAKNSIHSEIVEQIFFAKKLLRRR